MKGCTEKNGNPRDTECYYNAGLALVLRIGPWCHGEVRYGGFPDYVALMPGVRSNNARYLARVEKYWKELYNQVREFCDGKTVIGIQLENEYTGNIGHIVRLRELAEKVGGKGRLQNSLFHHDRMADEYARQTLSAHVRRLSGSAVDAE